MAGLSSVPSGVAICRNRNRDGTTNQKEKFVKIEFGVVTIVIIGNYGKPKKRESSTTNPILGPGVG